MSQSHKLSVPKKQKKFYSGKKKKHTLKTQVIFNPRLKQIVSIQIESGRKHDLTIARKHIKELLIYPGVMAYLAYKGFYHIKSKLLIPIKKTKNISFQEHNVEPSDKLWCDQHSLHVQRAFPEVHDS